MECLCSKCPINFPNGCLHGILVWMASWPIHHALLILLGIMYKVVPLLASFRFAYMNFSYCGLLQWITLCQRSDSQHGMHDAEFLSQVHFKPFLRNQNGSCFESGLLFQFFKISKNFGCRVLLPRPPGI